MSLFCMHIIKPILSRFIELTDYSHRHVNSPMYSSSSDKSRCQKTMITFFIPTVCFIRCIYNHLSGFCLSFTSAHVKLSKKLKRYCYFLLEVQRHALSSALHDILKLSLRICIQQVKKQFRVISLSINPTNWVMYTRFLHYRITKVHLNTSNQIIIVTWLFPVIWLLWSWKWAQ